MFSQNKITYNYIFDKNLDNFNVMKEDFFYLTSPLIITGQARISEF